MSSSSSYAVGSASPRQVARSEKAAARKALAQHVKDLTKLVSVGTRLAAAIYGSKDKLVVNYNYGGAQSQELTKTSYNAFKRTFKSAVKDVVLEAVALNKRKPRAGGSAGNFGKPQKQNAILVQFFGQVNLGQEMTTNPPGAIVADKKGKPKIADGASFVPTGQPVRNALVFTQPGVLNGVVSGGTITQLWHLYRTANNLTLPTVSNAMMFLTDVRQALAPLIQASIQNDLNKLQKLNGSVTPQQQAVAQQMLAKINAAPQPPTSEMQAKQMMAANRFAVNKASEKPVSFFDCDLIINAHLSKLTSALPVPKAESAAAVAAAERAVATDAGLAAAVQRERMAIVVTSLFNRKERSAVTAQKRKAAAALKPKKVRAKK